MASETAKPSPLDCYHCGETVPPGTDLWISIDASDRPMCCPGCAAVAEIICNSGMQQFYRQRTAFSQRPSSEERPAESPNKAYDNPAIAADFTSYSSDSNAHSRLLIGGINCAACTWLIEKTLSRLSGIERVNVSLSQSRLDVEYQPDSVALSEIFDRVEALGYQVRPFQSSSQLAQMTAEYKSALRQLAVAGLGMMQVGMFAIALHAGDIQGIEPQYQTLLRWVSLAVASFVVVYSARGFFESAWRHLRAGVLVMDLPVSMAIGLAWLASIWATLSNSGQVYFDSVVMFTFFLLLGRFIERRMRHRDALAWFDAESILPVVVNVRLESHWASVARRQIKAGETIAIPTGQTIAIDAVITEGQSAVDESTFNGEQLPRQVSPGDTIFAGTVNLQTPLQALTQGSYADSRLAALQRSVDTGRAQKPALARLADTLASRFVGAVLLITLATALAWSFIDPSRVLWISLSVLVVSCPCALALATPAALAAAASALRAGGVIVRTENAIESLAGISHLIFDKTGTLTQGKLEVSSIITLDGQAEADIVDLAGALQVYSNHPVATAFRHFPTSLSAEAVQSHPGAGLQGTIQGRSYRIGSHAFCAQLAPTLAAAPDDKHYWVALCRQDLPLAWIGLSDQLRDEAPDVVRQAIQAGLQVELLSGDSSQQGPLVARSLAIDTVHTGVSPEGKMQRVRDLQASGARVAMVGDGLNDAPVLGLANASFAVAGATGLARTQADFIIAGGSLRAILSSWRKARDCRRIIRQNLIWALGYNLCAIPLAASGFIPPWAAAIGMSASSLLVVLNSMRLNKR